MIDRQLQLDLRMKYNPDGSQLRNLQLRLLEILKFFDDVCRKNNLKYWLSFGTCLGAIRHEGFIPWDDDIDIEMFREDYQKVCEILRAMPSSGYVLQDAKSDPEYLHPFVKLRDTRSIVKEANDLNKWSQYQGAFLDIFCVEPSFSKIVWRVGRSLWYRMVGPCSKIRNRFVRQLFIKSARSTLGVLYAPIRLINLLCRPTKSRLMLGCAFLEVRSNKYLTDVMDWPFEDGKFYVPSNYDGYLTEIYGDYKTLPSEKDIQIHFFNMELK